MKKSIHLLQIVTFCFMLFSVSVSAALEEKDDDFFMEDSSYDGESFEEFLLGDAKKWTRLPWLVPLAKTWRREYLKESLACYLFREDTADIKRNGMSDSGLGNEFSMKKMAKDHSANKAYLKEICRTGDNYLVSGLLPEAMLQYKQTVRKTSYGFQRILCAEFGMLKVNLAMGRQEEAKKIFNRLVRERDIEKMPLFILLDGMLSFFDGNYDRASRLFMSQGTYWYLCPNIEMLAAYSLLEKKDYENADKVFNTLKGSPWTALQEFGTLGRGDVSLGLKMSSQHKELSALRAEVDEDPVHDFVDLGALRTDQEKKENMAEEHYSFLMKNMSPFGFLGLAEYRMMQGEKDKAIQRLRELIETTNLDYWKGVAFIYLIALAQHQEEWGGSLLLAKESRNVVLTKYWENQLKRLSINALEYLIGILFEKELYKEILFLMAEWHEFETLLATEHQLLIADAYKKLNIYGPALAMYKNLASTGPTFLAACRLAWECERYKEARTFLRRYHEKKSNRNKNEARLLGVCLLFQQKKFKAAKKLLQRGSHYTEDSSLLIAVGMIEDSLGLLESGIADLQAALDIEGLIPEEKPYLRYRIAEMYYRLGRFSDALNYLKPEGTAGDIAQSSIPKPLEIFSLLRLKQEKLAIERSRELSEGQGDKSAQEIVAVEELITSMRKNGYDFRAQ